MIADPLIDLPDDETRPSNYYLRDTIKLLMFRIDVDNKELDNKTHDTDTLQLKLWSTKRLAFQ